MACVIGRVIVIRCIYSAFVKLLIICDDSLVNFIFSAIITFIFINYLFSINTFKNFCSTPVRNYKHFYCLSYIFHLYDSVPFGFIALTPQTSRG